ncbi:MAG TPA: acyltransferase [Ktedonobacteraceae bacterium]|nr:acyltransferase [Ktedonobacteraceae bacterium]
MMIDTQNVVEQPVDEKRHGTRRVGQWIAWMLEDRQVGGKQNNIAVLDGVRAVAFLMVMVFHINRMTGDNLWDRMSNQLASSVSTAGGTGVTLFFVLSGFLLFMPFAKSLLFTTSWPLARVFYMRRFLRIIPGYYVCLLLLILLAYPEYLQPVHLKDLFLFLTFFMDSTTETFRRINGPFWTLATEWQFYMMLPLIALLIAWLVKKTPQRKRFKRVTLWLGVLIVLALGVRLFGEYFMANPKQSFLVPRPALNVFLFFSFGIVGKYTEDFAVGMFISLCYIYVQHPATNPKFAKKWRELSLWLWGAGILICVFDAMWHFNHEMHGWPFLNGLLPAYDWINEMMLTFGFGACIAAILYGPTSLKRPFEWPPLRWIGLISYSLYMWHLPLLIFFQSRILPLLHISNMYIAYGTHWIWAILVVFPFAFLSYVLVEKPWMKLGDRWRGIIETKRRAKLQARAAPEAPSASAQKNSIAAQEAVTR